MVASFDRYCEPAKLPRRRVAAEPTFPAAAVASASPLVAQGLRETP